MNVAELKKLLVEIPDHFDVLIPAEDETLNTPIIQIFGLDERPCEFITICLPEEYDTYYGKRSR